MLQGGLISWKNQKKRCVALFTAEAEYIAMASAAQKSIWLQQLIGELTNSELSLMLTYEDNQSAIAIANYPQFHGRAKHLEVKHHFVPDQDTPELLNFNIEQNLG